MKKYVLASFAILLAVGLNSFSIVKQPTKPNTMTTYWFYLSDGEPAGTSSSPTVSPLSSCPTIGPGCIEGFESATPLESRPNEVPDGEFKE